MKSQVPCPYCKKNAELKKGEWLYPKSRDLRRKFFWVCQRCDAYVGCHGMSTAPLGTLANKELREKRIECHEWFDKLWHDPHGMDRDAAYLYLAAKMGLSKKQCHIAKFNMEQCQFCIDLCNSYVNIHSDEQAL